jgi:hypothetical protein
METLSATTIFWLFILGVTTGWIIGYWVGHEGITLVSNLIWGGASAVLIGIIALSLQLSGVLLFALMGTLATLFIANVFHLHHIEDVKGDIDRGIKVIRER